MGKKLTIFVIMFQIVIVHFVIASVPSVFTTLFYGSMSDATGRKPVLLCASIGGLINCFIVSMTVTLGMYSLLRFAPGYGDSGDLSTVEDVGGV